MATNAPNNVYSQHPDDDSVKLVYVEVRGQPDGLNDRHVFITWINGRTPEGDVTQIVHLTGGVGNYHYYPEVAKFRSEVSRINNQFFDLGPMTRAQRDQLLALARNVKYYRKSRVNHCRVWMRDLLEAMVNAGLISKEKFDEVDAGVPLVKRIPELPE